MKLRAFDQEETRALMVAIAELEKRVSDLVGELVESKIRATIFEENLQAAQNHYSGCLEEVEATRLDCPSKFSRLAGQCFGPSIGVTLDKEVVAGFTWIPFGYRPQKW